MDSANKQDAIIAEVTPGTTPSSPAFLLLRSTSISRSATRVRVRSPERRADRRASTMVAGNHTYSLTIVTPFVRDAATDVLWASLLNSSFSSNVMKDGSTATYFTLEEKYEAGATDPYHRHLGCRVTSLSIDFRLGEGGTMTWTILALSQTQATSAIASSTYAAPTPNVAPVSTPEISVSGLLGLSSPGVTSLRMTINNNMQTLHKFGSAEPTALSLGLFDVSGAGDTDRGPAAAVLFAPCETASGFFSHGLRRRIGGTGFGFGDVQRRELPFGLCSCAVAAFDFSVRVFNDGVPGASRVIGLDMPRH